MAAVQVTTLKKQWFRQSTSRLVMSIGFMTVSNICYFVILNVLIFAPVVNDKISQLRNGVKTLNIESSICQNTNDALLFKPLRAVFFSFGTLVDCNYKCCFFPRSGYDSALYLNTVLNT